MLTLEQINVSYGDMQALSGVSLAVGEGEVVAVVGSNGAGKTTTLRAISGLLVPRAGRITWAGERIGGASTARIVELGISHVPEGRQLFPSLTVLENLEMGAQTAAARAAKANTLDWIFALFPRLRERKGQRAGTLSGGEQQMLAIGRGLMALPRLLLLDEPSLGLAPMMVSAIFRVIEEINGRGTAVLLVEQNVLRALKLSRRGYVLENGRIVAEGPSESLVQDADIRRAYLGV